MFSTVTYRTPKLFWLSDGKYRSKTIKHNSTGGKWKWKVKKDTKNRGKKWSETEEECMWGEKKWQEEALLQKSDLDQWKCLMKNKICL